MSKNNPQYEDSIEGKCGEIVVDLCNLLIQVRCIDGIKATSVFLYPYQIPHLIDQLEKAVEESQPQQ